MREISDLKKLGRLISRVLGGSPNPKALHDAQVRALIRSLAPVATKAELVRIGGELDGGYLVPNDLEGIEVAVSPGVATEVSFDLAMAEMGLDVLMADGSVAGPPVQNRRFQFHPKFIDVFDDDRNMRLDSLCNLIALKPGRDRILQMDIEGAEYRSLLDLSDEALRSFRIMVIEFHHLDQMFSHFQFRMIRATFQKLHRHHHVVHIHPNNNVKIRQRKDLQIPSVMEFTFYRKDRAEIVRDRKLTFPHPLDRDNTKRKPSMTLPVCWQ